MDSEYFVPMELAERIVKNTPVEDKDLALNMVYKVTSNTKDTSLYRHEDFRKVLFQYLSELDNVDRYTKKDFWTLYIKNYIKNEEEYDALSGLALYLEKKCRNECKKSELSDLLKKHEISICKESFLLEIKDNNISFVNNAIQECLVANKLQDENIDDVFSEYLTVEIGNEQYLVPSWFNVLYLLLETEKAKEYIKKIFNIVEDNQENLTEQLMSLVVLTPSWQLDRELKDEIFKLVYVEYEENRETWFSWDFRSNLVKFLTEDIVKFLEKEYGKYSIEKNPVQIGNIIYLVSLTLEQKKALIDLCRFPWKRAFIDIVNTPIEINVPARYSLRGLALFEDTAVLKKIDGDEIINSSDTLLMSAYLDLLGDLKSNSSESIVKFISYVDSDSINLSVTARKNINKIDSKKGFDYLFSILLKKESEIRVKFWEDRVINEDFTKNLGQVIDKELADKIVQLLLQAFKDPNERFYAVHSQDINTLTEVLNKKGYNFIDEVISIVESQHDFYDLKNILVRLVNKNNIERIFKLISEKLDNPKKKLGDIVIWLESYNKKLFKEILDYSIKKELVDKDYVKSGLSSSVAKNRTAFILERFEKLLTPEQGKYNPEVFQFYSNNHKVLQEEVSKENKEKLERLCKETWIDSLNPQSFEVEKREDGQIYYPRNMYLYGDVIKCLSFLDNNYLQDNIQKLIDYIPFCTYENIDVVKDCILQSSKDYNWDFVEKVYLSPDNPIKELRPDSYVHICKELIEEEKRILLNKKVGECLKSILVSQNIQTHCRLEALSLLIKLEEVDEAFLIKIHKNAKEEDQKYRRGVEDILISEFENPEFIKMRTKDLKEYAQPFEKGIEPGVRDVSEYEREMREKRLYKPLTKLNIEYIKLWIDLYEFSGDQLQEDEKYRDFNSYIIDGIRLFVQNNIKSESNIGILFRFISDLISSTEENNALVQLESLRDGIVSEYSSFYA